MSENLGLVRAHSPSLSCYHISMHVELSAAAQERVESLVRDGAYPSVEVAVDVAIENLYRRTAAIRAARPQPVSAQVASES